MKLEYGTRKRTPAYGGAIRIRSKMGELKRTPENKRPNRVQAG